MVILALENRVAKALLSALPSTSLAFINDEQPKVRGVEDNRMASEAENQQIGASQAKPAPAHPSTIPCLERFVHFKMFIVVTDVQVML